MSITQLANPAFLQERARAKPRLASAAVSDSLEIEKVRALSILAAAAIFAPFAFAVLNQAAQIFAN